LFGGLGLLLAVSVMITTQALAGDIASSIGLGAEFAWLIQLARLPLIVLFVSFAIQMVYWIAPNRWRRPRFWSAGSLFFAFAWAAFTVGFAFYVSNFASYNATYGAIAGVVIMLLWFQVSSLLVLIGAELNAVLEARQRAPLVAPVALAPRPAELLGGSPARARASGGGLELAVVFGLFLALVAFFRRRPAS
jgi:membrane protein